MTDDRVFEANVGTEVAGATYEGRDAVRLGFMRAWQTIPDARWENVRHFLSGERDVSEWTLVGTGSDGRSIKSERMRHLSFLWRQDHQEELVPGTS